MALYELCPSSGSVVDVDADVVAPGFLKDYEAYGRDDDPVLDFVLRHRRPIDSSRVVSPQRWAACGARTALGEVGYGHSLEAPVVVAGSLFGTINFARSAEQPPFDEVDLASADLVGNHLGLALERAARYEATGARVSTLERTLDRMPQAVVVTDLDARVLFRNRRAREWGGALDAAERSDVARGMAAGLTAAMSALRTHGRRSHTHSVRTSQGQLIARTYRLGEHDGAAVTLFYAGADTPGSATLPAWDVLSRREQEIAAMVSRGLTSRQIADEAFISENTVKQHLKRIFAKADVRSRAELVQLIWASGSTGAAAAPEEPEPQR
jgi:DNA-binding CsgD family transcriptional regulator